MFPFPITLFRCGYYNSNTLSGGTASASSAVSPASNAVDGNTTTAWQASGAQDSTGWWSYDLGSGVIRAFAKVRQYWDGSSSGIKTATIKASNTGAFGGEEITVASGVDFGMASGAGWYQVTFTPPPIGYRYWRIFSLSCVNTTNGNRPLVYEFEAMEAPWI